MLNWLQPLLSKNKISLISHIYLHLRLAENSFRSSKGLFFWLFHFPLCLSCILKRLKVKSFLDAVLCPEEECRGVLTPTGGNRLVDPWWNPWHYTIRLPELQKCQYILLSVNTLILITLSLLKGCFRSFHDFFNSYVFILNRYFHSYAFVFPLFHSVFQAYLKIQLAMLSSPVGELWMVYN